MCNYYFNDRYENHMELLENRSFKTVGLEGVNRFELCQIKTAKLNPYRLKYLCNRFNQNDWNKQQNVPYKT